MKARTYITAWSLGLLVSGMTLHAQGLLNNGARIVMNTGVAIVINGATGNYTSQAGGLITNNTPTGEIYVYGNWVNNAGNVGFSNDGSVVNFMGGAQTIGGTSSTTFHNVRLAGTGTKTLLINTTMGSIAAASGGVLNMGTRPLDLNSFMVTINNPLPAGWITSGGYVISETNVAGNPSIVRWNVGTNTAARTIPFGTAAGVLIPLTVTHNITGASATSFYQVATRPTAASDNLPWSTGVTHMFDPVLAQDGSDEAVIDRWWDFTFSGAATADITFSYRGVENTLQVPYNTGNIGAQYWSAAWLPNNATIGSAPAVLAGVGTVTANAVPFAASTFTPMVLSSVTAPLPIELIRFDGVCAGVGAMLRWSTATEINSSYFTLQRSDDGVTFRNITTIAAAGTSTTLRNYSYSDTEPLTTTTYYRLVETDINGQSKNSGVTSVEPCSDAMSDEAHVWSTGNDVLVSMNAASDQGLTVGVYDVRGRLIASQQFQAATGANLFTLRNLDIANGVYFVHVSGTTQVISQKVYLTRD